MEPCSKWDVSEVTFSKCTESIYIKPISMNFIQKMGERFQVDKKRRRWDMIMSHDSVACLLYHTEKRALVFVKQFRPAVYANRPLQQCSKDLVTDANAVDWSKHHTNLGLTHELCAGIVDKEDKSLVEIMQEEISEECGYNVPVETIQKITSVRSNVGTGGGQQTLYYAEIDGSMQINQGGGNSHDGELIDVVYVDVEDGLKFAFDESNARPIGFMFAVTWFYARHHGLTRDHQPEQEVLNGLLAQGFEE